MNSPLRGTQAHHVIVLLSSPLMNHYNRAHSLIRGDNVSLVDRRLPDARKSKRYVGCAFLRVSAVLVVLLTVWTDTGLAQSLPTYCEAVDSGLLGGLAAPYTKHATADGATYCEGVLPKPIGISPPAIISLKQKQSLDLRFATGTVASLSWASADRIQDAHLRLRSLQAPLFALDAAPTTSSFNWDANLIARLQPNWKYSAALLSQTVKIGEHTQEVSSPVRLGNGCSDTYIFTIRSAAPLHLTTALIQSVDGKFSRTYPISQTVGPVPNTLDIALSFKTMAEGVFLVSFNERVGLSGIVTSPLYVSVSHCK